MLIPQVLWLKRQQEQQEIEQQKERIETEKQKEIERKKCINCGKVLTEHETKKYRFDKGNICKSCFFSASNEQIREWGIKNA